jgi:hypothetical protein
MAGSCVERPGRPYSTATRHVIGQAMPKPTEYGRYFIMAAVMVGGLTCSDFSDHG